MTKILEAQQDLVNAGPGGMCDTCGHFALRHYSHDKCDGFPAKPCPCDGMKWRGIYIPIIDSYPNYLRAVTDPRNGQL